MRTTVSLDEDVVAAVEQLRRQEGLGLSEAVNRLVRAGLNPRAPHRTPFRQRTVDLGLTVEVDDIGAVLEVLDETP